MPLFSLFTLLFSVAVPVMSVGEISRHDFPPGFIFGSASSAYQVEGAVDEDGRTPSIWDTFTRTEYPLTVHGINISDPFHRGTADITSDQYHKYKEDVQLMAETGIDVYRFSVSWSRLIPYGRGPINPKGLQYYNDLINELLEHGVTPYVTLHHFDLPQALEDEYGGWLNRDAVRDFTDYADVCFREFGDRVSNWLTINELNMYASGGYDTGFSPPGRCSPPFGMGYCSKGNSTVEPYIALHNMLLAHASAARLYEKKYKEKQQGIVGLSFYAYGAKPKTESKEDSTATQRLYDFYLGWILHPLTYGDYPKSMKKIVGPRLPAFTDDEKKLVKGSFDYIGLINYLSVFVEDDSNPYLKERDYNLDVGARIIVDGKSIFDQYSAKPWGMTKVLEYIKHNYGNPPIIIVENGDMTKHDSSLDDSSRIEYLHAYITAVLHAIRKGSDIRGYIQWSFLDMYEVLTGYRNTFGLYYVDFNDPDRKRSPKLSAKWYSRLLKEENVGPHVGLSTIGKNPRDPNYATCLGMISDRQEPSCLNTVA